ncbi:MAG: hypothetical protein V3U67_00665 [Gemmatimonadota bacterium]
MIDRRRNCKPVQPVVALAILESLRVTDTPSETIDDEEFTQSLPRRLGLSEVIDTQIRRYTSMRDSGYTLEVGELNDLLRLIGRRPDAEAVFAAAGTRLARQHFDDQFALTRVGRRLFPAQVRERFMLRSAGRIARAVSPSSAVSTSRSPPELAVEDCVLSEVANGLACSMLTAAMQECLERYEKDGGLVQHESCKGRGSEACTWSVK